MDIRRLTSEEWAKHLPETGFELFHTVDGLEILERHSPYDLQCFGGFKGEQAVALIPIFRRSGPAGTTAYASPPPGRGVSFLGPLLMESSPKQRKREKVNEEFTSRILDALEIDARSLFFMLCRPEYDDPRPYDWSDLSVKPSFTYRIEIDGRTPEEVLASFSRSRRREIRTADEADLSVELGGLPEARRIFESAHERYAEQDEAFWGDWAYVRDVVKSFEEHVQIYTVREGNDFLGGVVVLYSTDTAYFWLGGVKSDNGVASVNSLLHWEIIRDIATDQSIETVDTYDLVGGATPRLCRYKSKFGPTLESYYKVTSGPLKMRLAELAYELTA